MSIPDSTNRNENSDHKDAAVKPDSETLNTTDPQEHMEGPLSSLMHKAEKSIEKQDTTDDTTVDTTTKDKTD